MKINRATAIGVTFGLAASILAVTAPQVSADGESVLFVTSNPATLPPADGALVDVIEAEGYSIVFGDDDAVTAADASAVSAVVISSSVVPAAVGDTFRNVATPVVAFEPYIFDDLGLTRSGNSNRGEVAGKRQLNIIDPSHPLAAGLSGTVPITESNVGISWGRAVSGADIIAKVPGSNAQSAIFVYETGAQMDGLVAPGTRIGMFPSFGTGDKLTADGRALVAAAVDYAVDGSGEPSNAAPAVNAGNDVNVAVGDPISVTGTVTDDGLPDGNIAIAWTGPAGVSFGTPDAVTSTVTVPGQGAYELTLTADDGELTTTDTVTITVSDGSPIEPIAGSVLYIAQSAAGVSAEQAAVQRLVANGYDVTVADDNTVDPADAAAHDLVIVSASISPSTLSDAWASVATPMVVWEPYVFDNLDFTANNSAEGAAGGQRDVSILSSDHPITSGFSGTVAVTTTGRALSWGKPQGDVDKLASHANTATKISIFSYEAGAQMDSTPAPARRVGFFLAANSPQVLTADGWTLFDRSVAWAMSTPKPAPTASASADIASGIAPQTVTFASAGSTGDIVSYDWDFGDGSNGTGTTPTHTYGTGGTYIATLTVTDDVFQQATASVTLTFGNLPPVFGGDDPIARYDFVQGASNGIVYDTSGIGAPLDLTVQNPSSITWLSGGGINIPSSARLASNGPASKIIDAVAVTEAITIEAWIDPANLTQSGPARIATLSNGVTEANDINLMLGQGFKSAEGDRIEGRFRTSGTTDHGQPGVLSQDAALDGGLVHVVFTREPSGLERIYINGSMSTEWTVGGDVDVWDPTTPLVLANDAVASRPWRGDMHLLQIFDRALDEDEVCANAAQGPGRTIGSANVAPFSCLLVSDRAGVAPHSIDFDGTSSSDVDGSITSRTWDFGDGSTSSNPALSHTFNTPGEFVVSLTVTDDDGATRTATTTVEIADPNPAALTLQDKSGMRVGNGFFKENEHAARETWLGRELNWTAQFTDHRTASAMGSSSNGLFTSNNAQLPDVADRMNATVSVGLAFGLTDLKNGGVPAVAINLQKTIDGDYDFLYYRVASRAVEGGYPDAVIRLGHEFNGKWAPWSSQGNEPLFIEAWRHVHDLFQNVSPDFRYDWGGLKEGWNGTAPQAYPGDAYVDIVSQSVYWKKKPGFTVWDEQLWTDRFIKPMNDARVFAAAHGKQVAYSEWGILQLDEPLFITRMHEWMTSLPDSGPGSMAYNVYWDSSSTLNRLSQHPAVEARYKLLFG